MTSMIIEAGAPLPQELRGAVIAIGNFDGIHRGHQQLLAETQAEARRRNTNWALVTFEPHPRSFFRPAEPVFRLTPLPLKARLVAALGASFTAVLAFDAAFAAMTPEDFVRRQLSERLGVAHVVTGYDFHFGHGRKGTPETMRALGRQLGFGVTVIDQVTDDDGYAPFSSSAIRDSLRHGHVSEASRQLGYHWTVMGEVVHGDQRGRTIGFPTLNIVLPDGSEPFQGIYAVRVRDAAVRGMTRWKGAGYFGRRPTFASEKTFLEVHLLGFDGDLYGKTMLVDFIDLIRPDRRFDTIDDLVAQMKLDCAAVERRLAAEDAADPLSGFPLAQAQRNGIL
ncbi:bifunctional riboflavin kinase/FAD synthetase [Taklimakanibacter lacteus]|uniref:bifunctional riboflavin kinase/FAD synthetase n=1 Tax=Taklimakanibacter lacteus TaxID=2268456 RepID=UPI000E6722EF